MSCSHYSGTCGLVEEITGLPCATSNVAAACGVCMTQWRDGVAPTRERPTPVVRDLCAATRRRSGDAYLPIRVGDILKRRIQEIWNLSPCQACNDLAEQMNAWGVDGCRSRLDEIVANIKPRAVKWGIDQLKTLSLRNLVKAAGAAWSAGGIDEFLIGLVTEAIDEAEASRLRRPLDLRPQPGKSPRLAVVAALFNPGDAEILHDNWRQWREHMNAFDLHSVTTVQLVWPDQPRLGDIVIEAEPGQVMFQKEALLNVGFRSLPDDVQYVAWLDADLIFDRDDWARAAVDALQGNAAVHLFSEVIRERSQGGPLETSSRAPGGGWAAHRGLLSDGLYAHAVLGGGDDIARRAMVGKKQVIVSTEAARLHAAQWGRHVNTLCGRRVATLDGSVRHLYHGEWKARRYQDRHRWLTEADWNPATDVTVASNGLLQWTRGDVAEIAESYFQRRTAEFA